MTDDIQRSLGRLEGKLDALLASHREKEKKQEALDARLRNAETEINSTKTTTGLIASGASIAISVAAAIIPSWFHR